MSATGDTAVNAIAATYGRDIASKIAAQLRAHRDERPAAYTPEIRSGWTTLHGIDRTVAMHEPVRDFRMTVTDRYRIRQMRFGRFSVRSLFHETWFDSDGERRFAVLLEDEPDQAIKWFRPGPRDIHLYWNADQQYEPDFIVETAQQKLMIEVKSADEIEDSDVQKKARALSTGARTRAHTRILSAVSGGSTCSCPIPRSGQPRRLTR